MTTRFGDGAGFDWIVSLGCQFAVFEVVLWIGFFDEGFAGGGGGFGQVEPGEDAVVAGGDVLPTAGAVVLKFA